jgi:hypothetical protein
MKTKREKEWNADAEPPRWEYLVSDGITATGMWSTEELDEKMEKYTYTKLEELLEEENANSDKH